MYEDTGFKASLMIFKKHTTVLHMHKALCAAHTVAVGAPARLHNIPETDFCVRPLRADNNSLRLKQSGSCGVMLHINLSMEALDRGMDTTSAVNYPPIWNNVNSNTNFICCSLKGNVIISICVYLQALWLRQSFPLPFISFFFMKN